MKMLKSVKGIILLNILLTIPNIILYVAVALVPFLFIANIVLAILNSRKEKKELAVTHLICAFVVPLIGPSICFGYLSVSLGSLN
jgi:cytochrome bd-type quinol oxidase subunit 2